MTMTPRRLRKLRISEISLVDRGANPFARVELAKRDGLDGQTQSQRNLLELVRAKASTAGDDRPAFRKAASDAMAEGLARATAILKSAKGASDGATASIALTVPVAKVDQERHQIAGWANVSSVDGRPVVDLQGDVIDVADLRQAAHDFIAGPRHGLAMHDGRPVMQVVESAIVDDDTAAALNIMGGVRGWWVVAQVTDAATWQRVKNGQFRSLSIAGTADIGEA